MGWRRQTTVGVAVLGVLAWWLWPAPEPPSTEVPRVAQLRQTLEATRSRPVIRQPVPRFGEAEPTEQPVEMPVKGEYGRLIIDVVDEGGRTAIGAQVAVRNCEAFQSQPGLWRARGSCTIEAWRRDGSLFARSEPVQVEATPGDEVYRSIELRSARTGGLGVQIGWDGTAVVVQRVMPGTPAEAQGLAAGDRITEVDGIPVGELGLRGFIKKMTGPEGTDVHFVLAYDDDEQGEVREELAITRAFLES